MAHIIKIMSDTVGKDEGCLCDRCGQYITNIITVRFAEGITMHYGTTCFDKLCKSGNLNKHGKHLMNKALKDITYYSQELEKYKSGEYTAENDNGYIADQPKPDGAWYTVSWATNMPYEEYREYMITELLPYRLAEAQKIVDKFAKINFEP